MARKADYLSRLAYSLIFVGEDGKAATHHFRAKNALLRLNRAENNEKWVKKSVRVRYLRDVENIVDYVTEADLKRALTTLTEESLLEHVYGDGGKW
jgi:hypothetical protein